MGLWIFYESSNVTLHLLKIDGIKVVEGQMASSGNSSLTKFDFAAQSCFEKFYCFHCSTVLRWDKTFFSYYYCYFGSFDGLHWLANTMSKLQASV